MHLSELLTTELAEARRRAGRDALTILETGSIRGDGADYRSNDGWSSLTFAQQARDHGGHLYSVDLDTAVAAAVLDQHDLAPYVTLIEGHSIDVLADMLARDEPHLDVAYLDSDNNADLILHEYFLVSRMMRPGGVILVDDVNLEPDTDVVKGHAIVPWLDRRGIQARLQVRNGDGYSTGVLAVET